MTLKDQFWEFFWQLVTMCQFTKYNNFLENIDFWLKIYLIVYPSLENSTTHITIIMRIPKLKQFGPFLSVYLYISISFVEPLMNIFFFLVGWIFLPFKHMEFCYGIFCWVTFLAVVCRGDSSFTKEPILLKSRIGFF